jgi:hypothetical protein
MEGPGPRPVARSGGRHLRIRHLTVLKRHDVVVSRLPLVPGQLVQTSFGRGHGCYPLGAAHDVRMVSLMVDLPGGRPLPPWRPATRARPDQAATPRAARCCPRDGARPLHLCCPPARFGSKHERRAGKRLDVTQ